MTTTNTHLTRCDWCGADPDYVHYHDTEWGVPQKDSQRLFEFLVLEGAQAGLSWITILRKREGYRRIFDDFDVQRLSAWEDHQLEAALRSPLIVRNRLKVRSVRENARAVLNMQSSGVALSDYLWAFVDHTPVVNHCESMAAVPAQTELSRQISSDLKKRGFKFVGPTIMYAFMQATGMVNDHLVSCFRHSICARDK